MLNTGLDGVAGLRTIADRTVFSERGRLDAEGEETREPAVTKEELYRS